MRTRYFEDLGKIRKMQEKLSQYVLLAYDKFEAYVDDEDEDYIHDLLDIEHDIKWKASEVEKYCYDLLALQQPVAKDLRFLQMSIKMASNFKRIANHLSQAGIIMLEYPLRDEEKDLVKDFVKNQKSMTIGAKNAFIEYDKDLAKKTIEEDSVNNELFEKAIEFLVDLTKKDLIKPKELSDKVLFFKYFERLGDRLGRNADFAKRL